MITNDLSVLKIHKFQDDEQHKKAIASGLVSETDLCIVPEDTAVLEDIKNHLTSKNNPHNITFTSIDAASAANTGNPMDTFNLGAYLLAEGEYINGEGTQLKSGCSLYTFSGVDAKTLSLKTYAFGDMCYHIAYTEKTDLDHPTFITRELNPGISEDDIKANPKLGICELDIEVPDRTDFFWISFYTNEFFSEPTACIKRGTAWDEIKTLDTKLTDTMTEHITARNPHGIVLNELQTNDGEYYIDHLDSFVDSKLAFEREDIDAELDKIREESAQVDTSNIQLRSITYEATPENINTVLANAQPNSTVMLTNGEYPLLFLKGKSAYPDDLMLVGESTNGVKVAGLCITGGQTNNVGLSVCTEDAQMPKNLYIKNITFTDTVSIKNGIYDGLTIRNCKVTSGGIAITPNRFDSKYDEGAPEGGTSTGATNRRSLQTTKGKNILIRGCTITNSDSYYADKAVTSYAVYIDGCDDVTMYYNTITDGGHTAIYIHGLDRYATTGKKINIGSNTITNVSRTFIKLYYLTDAECHVLNNTLTNCSSTAGEYIVVESCQNSRNRFMRSPNNDGKNTYSDADTAKFSLTTANGIIVKGSSLTYATPTDIENLETSINSHKSAYSGHISARNPHGITADMLGIDLSNIAHVSRTIEVTPSMNLADTIKNAQEGAIIELQPGNYPKLTLSGNDSFKRNITITGMPNAKIAGVSITSGIGMLDDLLTHRDCDIQRATLSSNLTFKNISFTQPLCVKNCIIEGLSVIGCVFEAGSLLQVVPSMSRDWIDQFIEYDNGNGAATYLHIPEYATRYAKNILVKGCTFINANLDTTASAIYMKSIDSTYIMENDIQAAAHNGIQIAGVYESNRFNARSTGKISITKNKISNTGDRAINIHGVDDAYIRILHNNLTNVNIDITDETKTEYVKVSNFNSATKISTKFAEASGNSAETNTYRASEFNDEGEEISGSIISAGEASGANIFIKTTSTRKTNLENRVEAVEEIVGELRENPYIIAQNTDPDNLDNYGWTWRKWNDGTVEMWCRVEPCLTATSNETCITLPCSIYDLYNLQFTHTPHEGCTFDCYLQDGDTDVFNYAYLCITALFYETYDEVWPTINVYIVGKY